MKKTITLLSAVTSIALISCDKPAESNNDAATQSAVNVDLLSSIITDQAPENALSITEVRKTIEIGKEITLTGKVMGDLNPFVEGRAMVLLGDPNIITSCDLRSGDHCKTPWDVCCDEPEVVKASIATIQILDQDGRSLKQGLKGVSGIKELSNLIVTGSIAKGSNDNNLLVNATNIYVQKAE